MTDTLRDRIALAVAAHRNGPASDGQGWFRDDADMAECYALADALLPLVAAEHAAAYRAAADEITTTQDAADTTALADHDELYDTEQHTSRAIHHAADRLRARADQMGQQ